MAIDYSQIHPAYQNEIKKSVQEIKSRLRRQEVRQKLPKDLLDELEKLLNDKAAPRVRLSIDDSQSGNVARWAHTGGYCIDLRPESFLPWEVTGKPRLTAVLFHELVHVASGWELDAEVYENRVFSPDEGASPFTDDDWKDFKANKGEGYWLYLDLNTGQVTDLWRKPVCQFKRKPNQIIFPDRNPKPAAKRRQSWKRPKARSKTR